MWDGGEWGTAMGSKQEREEEKGKGSGFNIHIQPMSLLHSKHLFQYFLEFDDDGRGDFF